MNDNPISWLQNWYTTQCDGDWEHDYGITIGTLDNPGWYVVINLVETPLEAAAFEPGSEAPVGRRLGRVSHCRDTSRGAMGVGW